MKGKCRVLPVIIAIIMFAAPFLFAGGSREAAGKGTIIFGDSSWDSIQVHNRIASFILKHGYGYDADYTPGNTIPVYQGLMQGDIHVIMESWTENVQEVYDKGISSKTIIDLGPNFKDSSQGWWVPSYMVKGDPERGIKPSAPDLLSVDLLPKYRELFSDPEEPSKGRLYVGPPGWAATTAGTELMEKLGLDKHYNAFMPGSDAALSGSMIAAYRKGEPWLGYYWEPTWVLGSVDMILLKGSEWPPTQVNILINPKLQEFASDAVEFLKKYETKTSDNNEFLAVMKENNYSTAQTAEWFIKNREEIWNKWVSSDIAAKVKAALK